MRKPKSLFPELRACMRRSDAFVLGELRTRVPRLAGLVERSDAMVRPELPGMKPRQPAGWAEYTSRHRGGSGKFCRARSRLYRSQIWQVNMRLKVVAEIYTMHSFALL